MTEKPASPVVRLADLPLTTHSHGSRYAAATARVAAPLGATRLGARLVVVPAGKRAWPYHCHHANDELFVILSGSGTLRYGGTTVPLAAGEVVVCPAGGPETAHQIVNDSDGELRYLAVSSMHDPDVFEYPDTGRFGVSAGRPPGSGPTAGRFHHFGRAADATGYWDGED